MTSYIKVCIKPFEQSYDKYSEFVIPIDEGMLIDLIEPVHEGEDLFLPLQGAKRIKNIISERKTKIKEYRSFWSKKLSQVITEKILDQLESNDTIDGYLKKDL